MRPSARPRRPVRLPSGRARESPRGRARPACSDRCRCRRRDPRSRATAQLRVVAVGVLKALDRRDGFDALGQRSRADRHACCRPPVSAPHDRDGSPMPRQGQASQAREQQESWQMHDGRVLSSARHGSDLEFAVFSRSDPRALPDEGSEREKLRIQDLTPRVQYPILESTPLLIGCCDDQRPG
jgi:hypothetical protein